jgi:hypothetical protein
MDDEVTAAQRVERLRADQTVGIRYDPDDFVHTFVKSG